MGLLSLYCGTRLLRLKSEGRAPKASSSFATVVNIETPELLAALIIAPFTADGTVVLKQFSEPRAASISSCEKHLHRPSTGGHHTQHAHSPHSWGLQSCPSTLSIFQTGVKLADLVPDALCTQHTALIFYVLLSYGKKALRSCCTRPVPPPWCQLLGQGRLRRSAPLGPRAQRCARRNVVTQ